MGAKILGVTTFVVAILIAAALHTAEAETHSVNWSNSVGADFYTSWAANRTFKVGDTLVFQFTTGVHDVAELDSKDAFDTCSSTGVIGTPKSNGPANYTLSAVGNRFFICQIPGHCDQGQKLSITVTSATPSTPAPAPSTTSPTPPPSEATTPPPSGTTAPPPSGTTTPPPTSTSAPPPSTTNTTAPPPEGSSASSSRVAIVSSVFVAISMAFFCLF